MTSHKRSPSCDCWHKGATLRPASRSGRMCGASSRSSSSATFPRATRFSSPMSAAGLTGARRRYAPLPYRLDQDPELTARWGRLEEVDQGEISTPGGQFRYRAIPVRSAGTPATFVVGIFRDREAEELNDAITALAGVGLALLLAGSRARLAAGRRRAQTGPRCHVNGAVDQRHVAQAAHPRSGKRRDRAARRDLQRDAM